MTTAHAALDLPTDALAARIAASNRAYYDGAQPLDDSLYDALKAELRRRDPSHPLLAQVGAPVNPKSALAKAKHRIPMGSLENATSTEDIGRYVRRVVKLLEEAGGGFPKVFTVEPKLDGFSIDLRYEGGVLVQAITRGDGVVGEDVTHNLMRANGVPRVIAENLNLSVRGETVVHRDDFARHFAGDANPRSSAAGTARRLDGLRAEHLQFYAFNAVLDDGTPLAKTEQKSLDALRHLGFRVVESRLVGGETADDLIVALTEAWEEYKILRVKMPYDIDGLVAKVANLAKSALCGESQGCPRAMVAMKWAGSMVAQTTVVGLFNSVGRTGAITPVAVVREVECGGVRINRVSLANWDEVMRLGVGMGAEVTVERAGEVIPKVTKVTKPPVAVFERPARCPECDQPTKVDGPRQLCTNPSCQGQAFRKVYHWVQKRAIMHLGEECVDALMAVDGPVKRAADLYTVTMPDLVRACGGAVMARKVAASLEASRDCALHDLIGCVGVPGLGSTDALKVCRTLKLQTIHDLFTLDGRLMFAETDLLRVPSFAEEKAAKAWNGLRLWAADLLALEQHLRVSAPPAAGAGTGPMAGKKFCITGATEMDREHLKRVLCAAGGEWHSSVVNGLDYLVMADPNSASTKAEAARKKGIRCVSEKEVLDLAGYGG